MLMANSRRNMCGRAGIGQQRSPAVDVPDHLFQRGDFREVHDVRAAADRPAWPPGRCRASSVAPPARSWQMHDLASTLSRTAARCGSVRSSCESCSSFCRWYWREAVQIGSGVNSVLNNLTKPLMQGLPGWPSAMRRRRASSLADVRRFQKGSPKGELSLR